MGTSFNPHNWLFEQASQDNEVAFEEFYTTYFVPLYKYVFMRIQDKEEAKDIVQLVFTRLYEKRDTLDKERVHALMYASAKNAIIDHWRKKKPIYVGEDEDEVLENEASEEKDPQAHAITEENKRIVKVALKVLSDLQQEVILLKYAQGLSSKEVATIVGKSEEAVRQLQCRGLKQLRDYLLTRNYE